MKWNSSHQYVDLYYNYQQGPLASHCALKMEAVRVSEMSALQNISACCHQPETGSTLALNCHEAQNVFSIVYDITLMQLLLNECIHSH